MLNLFRSSLLFTAALIVTQSAQAHDGETTIGIDEKTTDIIVESMVDVAGRPVTYPEGPGKISIAVITLGPEAGTSWHIHETPLAAYVLEGQLSINYGDAGIKVFNPGDGFVEAVELPHKGSVTSDEPVKLVVFYAGDADTPKSVAVEESTQ